jgi:hypothetical protein
MFPITIAVSAACWPDGAPVAEVLQFALGIACCFAALPCAASSVSKRFLPLKTSVGKAGVATISMAEGALSDPPCCTKQSSDRHFLFPVAEGAGASS